MRNSRGFLERTVSNVKKSALIVAGLGGLLVGGCPPVPGGNLEQSGNGAGEEDERRHVQIGSGFPEIIRVTDDAVHVRAEDPLGDKWWKTFAQPGQFLVNGNPDGFIREVTGEPSYLGGVVIEIPSKPVSVAEAFPDGDFYFVSGDGKSLLREREVEFELFDFERRYMNAFYLEDLPVDFDMQGVSKINLKFKFDYGTSEGELDKFQAVFQGDMGMANYGELELYDELFFEKEKLVASNSWPFAGVFAGVPVTVVLGGKFYLGADFEADGRARFNAGSGGNATVEFGVEYDKREGWRTVGDQSAGFDTYFRSAGFDGEATGRFYIRPEFSVRLYGFVGAETGAEFYSEVTGEGRYLNSEGGSEWKLYAGARAPVEVGAKFFDYSLPIYRDEDVFDDRFRYLIASSDSWDSSERVTGMPWDDWGFTSGGGGGSGGSGGGSSGGSGSSGGGSSGGGGSGGGSSDGGGGSGGSGGSGGGSSGGGDPCGGAAGVSLSESEPNNTLSSADSFTLGCDRYVISGVLSSQSDVDNFSFPIGSRDYSYRLISGNDNARPAGLVDAGGVRAITVRGKGSVGYPHSYQLELLKN